MNIERLYLLLFLLLLHTEVFSGTAPEAVGNVLLAVTQATGALLQRGTYSHAHACVLLCV